MGPKKEPKPEPEPKPKPKPKPKPAEIMNFMRGLLNRELMATIIEGLHDCLSLLPSDLKSLLGNDISLEVQNRYTDVINALRAEKFIKTCDEVELHKIGLNMSHLTTEALSSEAPLSYVTYPGSEVSTLVVSRAIKKLITAKIHSYGSTTIGHLKSYLKPYLPKFIYDNFKIALTIMSESGYILWEIGTDVLKLTDRGIQLLNDRNCDWQRRERPSVKRQHVDEKKPGGKKKK